MKVLVEPVPRNSISTGLLIGSEDTLTIVTPQCSSSLVVETSVMKNSPLKTALSLVIGSVATILREYLPLERPLTKNIA